MAVGRAAAALVFAAPPLTSVHRRESRVYPAEAASVPAARRFVRDALVRWQRDDLDESGALLASELVTNAVLHARSTVEVELADDGQLVVLTVIDSSPALPVVRRHSRESATGRGLWLLDQYSSDRGIEIAEPGKRVWAVLCPELPMSDSTPEGVLSDWLDAVEAL